MNKKIISYEQAKQECKKVCDLIQNEDISYIVAVVRGGTTLAHCISRMTNIPMGFYFPKQSELILPSEKLIHIGRLNFGNEKRNLLFVEDIIAEGRTLDNVVSFMSTLFPGFNYKFWALARDSDWDDTEHKDILLPSSYKGKEWVVMPWEEESKVIVGDRGLNRDGTDIYGVSK